MRIYATLPPAPDFNDFRQSGGHYFKDELLRVQIWSDSLEVLDLRNAMKPGQFCRSVKFNQPFNSQRCEMANLFHQCGQSFRALFDLLGAAQEPHPYKSTQVELFGYSGTVYVSDAEAKRTFSPFATLPALKEEPKKWTLPHVVRALLNGQYRNLRCTGYYTDDYAFDASTNYQRGAKSALHLVDELITSPRGWWTAPGKDEVSICCHSFDCNRFEFVLHPTPLTVAEQLDRYCLDFPNFRAERHPNGNALLCSPAACDYPLAQLAEATSAAGATTELETNGEVTYLAVYPNALTMAQ